jgi:hypothetical protein
MWRGDTGVQDVAAVELDGIGGWTLDEDDVGGGNEDGAIENDDVNDDDVDGGITKLDDDIMLVWLLVSETA